MAEPVLVDSLAVEPVVDARAAEHATEHATEQARIDESTALVEQDSLVTEDADYAPDVTPASSRRAFFPLQRRGPQPAEPAELSGPAAVAEPVAPAEPVVPVADLAAGPGHRRQPRAGRRASYRDRQRGRSQHRG